MGLSYTVTEKHGIRPKPGTVIDEQKGYRKTVVTRIVEKTNKLIIHTHTTFNKKAQWQGYVPKDCDGTVTYAKMLCVNGPLAGQWHVPEDMEDRYHTYNCASRHRRGKREAPGTPPKCVLVYL